MYHIVQEGRIAIVKHYVIPVHKIKLTMVVFDWAISVEHFLATPTCAEADCAPRKSASRIGTVLFLSKMTDQMETRKRKLIINIRHMDFILDDDEDVDGDDCNAVAHTKQEIF